VPFLFELQKSKDRLAHFSLAALAEQHLCIAVNIPKDAIAIAIAMAAPISDF